MKEERSFSKQEMHLHFARQFNSRVWELLGAPERSSAQDMEMIHAAHASMYHWLLVGNTAHQQRGEWLIARVYTVLENPDGALRHARRCFELTTENPEEMEDFDVAYAHEAMARASALAGGKQTAREHREKARLAGENIQGKENRTLFLSDFEGGDWFGLA